VTQTPMHSKSSCFCCRCQFHALLDSGETIQALRLVRHVMRHEAAVLGLDPNSGTPLPPGALAAIRAQAGQAAALD